MTIEESHCEGQVGGEVSAEEVGDRGDDRCPQRTGVCGGRGLQGGQVSADEVEEQVPLRRAQGVCASGTPNRTCG